MTHSTLSSATPSAASIADITVVEFVTEAIASLGDMPELKSHSTPIGMAVVDLAQGLCSASSIMSNDSGSSIESSLIRGLLQTAGLCCSTLPQTLCCGCRRVLSVVFSLSLNDGVAGTIFQ